MAAIVEHESTWHPTAIGDNSVHPHASYYPATFKQAVELANLLIGQHHNIDLGLAGINSSNLAGYHVTVAQALAPCVNLAIGADILNNGYFGRRRPIKESNVASPACHLTVRREADGSITCRSGGAVDVYGPGDTALSAALEAYNSNSYTGAPTYALDIIQTAQQVQVTLPMPDISLSQTGGAAPTTNATAPVQARTPTAAHAAPTATPIATPVPQLPNPWRYFAPRPTPHPSATHSPAPKGRPL
jgi:hypothetical protein